MATDLPDLSNIAYKDAVALIPSVNSTSEAYANGDHWQSGTGWAGPLPSSNHPSADMALAYIERIFVSDDVIGDILNRHASAIMGRTFNWTLVEDADPTTPEATSEVTNQLRELLQQWINENRVESVIKQAISDSLWARRGLIRIYIPNNRLRDGTVPPLPFADILDIIKIDSPTPRQAAVIDEAALQQGGVHLYTIGDTNYAAIYYVDNESAENESVLTVIDSDGNPVTDELRLNLDRNLLLYQINNEPLIDESMRSLQRKVNHAETAGQSNLTTAGWVTRLFLNANPPGKWVTDSNGEKTFVPSAIEFGPGRATFIPGIALTDSDGAQRLSTPVYARDEPSPNTTFTEAKREARAAMLHNARQEHILMADDPNASGSSRLRARSDFQASLAQSKNEADKAITWLLRTLILFAGRLASDGEQYTNIQVSAEAVVDVGTLAADEIRTIADLWKIGAISRQTMLNWLGIADPTAEIERIKTEAEAEAGAGAGTDVNKEGDDTISNIDTAGKPE